MSATPQLPIQDNNRDSDEDDAGRSNIFTMASTLQTVSSQHYAAAQAVSLYVATLAATDQGTAEHDFSVNTLAPKVERLQSLMNAHGSVFRSVTGFS